MPITAAAGYRRRTAIGAANGTANSTVARRSETPCASDASRMRARASTAAANASTA